MFLTAPAKNSLWGCFELRRHFVLTKLYLVEGLPCSGKSTTSEFVARLLEEQGKNVRFFDEGTGNHPADYEFHSFLDFKSLKALEPGLRNRIQVSGQKTDNGYIIPLSDFGGAEFQALIKYKIYDFLPWEVESPLMLARWRTFAEQAERESCVYVFNCVFLQNPMCETMMRFDFPSGASFSYIQKIYETIRPLNPRLIYLQNNAIAASVLKAAQEREGWLESVIDYHVNGGYGKRVGAQGFEGYISCLEERQRRELEFLKRLELPTLILEDSQNDWQPAYEKIRSFIQ